MKIHGVADLFGLTQFIRQHHMSPPHLPLLMGDNDTSACREGAKALTLEEAPMARAKGMMICFMFFFWVCLQSNLLEFAKEEGSIGSSSP